MTHDCLCFGDNGALELFVGEIVVLGGGDLLFTPRYPAFQSLHKFCELLDDLRADDRLDLASLKVPLKDITGRVPQGSNSLRRLALDLWSSTAVNVANSAA